MDYASLADKYQSKQAVNPYFPVAKTYRVIRKARDIDKVGLPDRYVMKATHNWNRSMLVVDGRFCGMNRNRLLAGVHAHNTTLKALARLWLQPAIVRQWKEVHYSHVRPGVLFEELIDPVDYELQFFLFFGICRMTMVLKRNFFHNQGTIYRLYDQDWHDIGPGSEETRKMYDDSPDGTPHPGHEVFSVLGDLCGHIDHVRVDFFVSGGQLYFSEFTFTHNGGNPSLLGKFDAVLSRYWTR